MSKATQYIARRIQLGSLCRNLFFLVFLFHIGIAHGQISIDKSNSLELDPINLIQNVFIGDGVKIESLDFRGNGDAIGVFRNAEGDIGLDRGLVISTGRVQEIAQANTNRATGSTPGPIKVNDPELSTLAGNELFDVAVVEIQFRPVDSEVGFNFVFGSEEYPEYVCSQFNDVFAFFIDGPNPDGGQYNFKNIALVPDPNDPTGNTYTDYPVTINSVNNGEVGEDSGDAICDGDLENLGFSQYFNKTGASRTFMLDGFLDAFKARADVIPCELYTLKIAIGDRGDFGYDSAVFLEAKSFASSLHEVAVEAPGVDYTLMEGCDPAFIEVSRTYNLHNELNISYDIITGTGSATASDYTLSSNEIVIPAGEEKVRIEVNAINDGITEGDETIQFVFQNGDCFKDTITLTILDHTVPKFAVPSDAFLCEGDNIEIKEADDLNQYMVFEKMDDIPIGDPERGDCRSSIVVSDIDIKYLNEQSFFQVCIDELEHVWIGEVEIYLVGPEGQIVELSTNNGGDGGNGDLTDQMVNTCFSLSATELINGGNSEAGVIIGSNPTYSGDFVPEQSLQSLFISPTSAVNGIWTLVIRDAEDNSNTGMLHQWSLKINSGYSEIRKYNINGVDVKGSPILIEKDAIIRQTITQNYGCTFEKEAEVSFQALPEAPSVDCSNPLRNQILLDWTFDNNVDEYEVKFETGQWEVYKSESEHLIENIGLSGTYNFQIRAVKNGCLGEIMEFTCSTPDCGQTQIEVDQIIPSLSGCAEDGVAVLSAEGEDGPYSFALESQFNSDGIFEKLSAGVFRVYVTDRYGCSYTEQIEVDGVPEFEAEIFRRKESCDPNIRGTAWVEVQGGTPPYRYIWNTGSKEETISKIRSGNYSVTVLDSNGCAMSKNIEVEKSDGPELDFTKVDVDCYGVPSGKATLIASEGEGPYQYRWSDGYTSSQAGRIDIYPGLYEVSVVDYNLCEAITIVEITQPDEILIEVSKKDNFCSDNDEGSIELEISGGNGPYEIFWDDGRTTTSITNLRAGQYKATVVDQLGCSSVKTIVIEEPESIQVEFREGDVSCFGGEDGTLSVSILNPSGTYELQWEGGNTLETNNNLGSGVHCVEITDEKGCTTTFCHELTEPTPIKFNAQTRDISCYGDSDGSIFMDISGGRAPYHVEMNGEVMDMSSDGVISGLRAGRYFVKAIDDRGCSETEIVEILDANEPIIVTETDDIKCSGDNSGSIFMTFKNEPAAPIEWVDENGNTYQGNLLSGLNSGVYSYTIKTEKGCILDGEIEINEPINPLQHEVNAVDITCFGDRNGSIVIEGLGGGGTYYYALEKDGFQSTGEFRGLREGVYETYVRDNNGCISGPIEIDILEPQTLEAILQRDTTMTIGEDLQIDLEVINSQGDLSYAWEVSNDQELLCDDCADQYVNNISDGFSLGVVVTDQNSCSDYTEMTVKVNREYKMYVPTGFSPNGDANNEILNVFGPDYAFVTEFHVFLRNGTNIYSEYDFEPNNTKIGWDGTFRDKKMPAGVYIWTMHVEFEDGVKESYKGSLQLLR